MKKKDLSKWNVCRESEGLLFFAQRMDELLFLYTLDTYKPSCLNAPFLVREALDVIDEIEKETLDKSSLSFVVEELKWSLTSDKTAKKLMGGEDFNSFVLDIENNPLSRIRVRLEVLDNIISPRKYLLESFSDLIDSVKSSHKKDIDFYAGKIITTMVNMGVSKRYLSRFVNDYFFSGGDVVFNDCNSIVDFIGEINPVKKKFDVCIKVSSLFNKISGVSDNFNTKIYSTLDQLAEGFDPEHGMEMTERYVFSVIESVSAFDPYSAFEQAESKIEKMANLFAIFHHKSRIDWDKNAAVKYVDSGYVEKIYVQNNPIKNGFDLAPYKASKALNNVISKFYMTTNESFFKFDSVVDLHALASVSDSYSTQLLNLWISVETLTPPSSSNSKIVNITKKIMPFIMLNYTSRLIRRLGGDINRWDRSEYRKILRAVDGVEEQHDKLAKFIMLDEYDELRKELYAKLDDFPLLRYRLFYLNEIFKNPKKVRTVLSLHLQKIEWQIRRIYRTRNLIVHSGRSPIYMSSIVENIHDYLDQIINEIMRLCAETRECTTLDQAYSFTDMKYKSYMHEISKVECFDEVNFSCAFRSVF